MKKNIKLILSLVVLLMIILSTNKVKAAVEAKAEANTETTFYPAYKMCYDMRNPTSSLGNNNLDPHLCTSKDYGAWAYLSLSAYGINGDMNSGGLLGGHYSSTGNMTGLGAINYRYSNPEIISALDSEYEKLGTTRYVDILGSNLTIENTKGMALAEIDTWYAVSCPGSSGNGVLARKSYEQNGWPRSHSVSWINKDTSNARFRPVIWNK